VDAMCLCEKYSAYPKKTCKVRCTDFIRKNQPAPNIMIKIACTSLIAFTFLLGNVSRAAEYPVKNCVVSGEQIGADMGAPYKLEYKGRAFILCCKSCAKKFNKNPEKYVKKYDEELAKSKK
jgi:YHS domain-containing protein